jgi:hypothetical protein
MLIGLAASHCHDQRKAGCGSFVWELKGVDIRDLCDAAIMASSKKIVAKTLICKGSKMAAGFHAITSAAAGAGSAASAAGSPECLAEFLELRL